MVQKEDGREMAGGEIRCKCGKINRVGAKFCTQCGEPIEAAMPTEPSEPADGKIICPMCGTANDPNMNFCTHCGEKLSGTIRMKKHEVDYRVLPTDNPVTDNVDDINGYRSDAVSKDSGKSMGALFWILGSILVIIIILTGAAGYLYYTGNETFMGYLEQFGIVSENAEDEDIEDEEDEEDGEKDRKSKDKDEVALEEDESDLPTVEAPPAEVAPAAAEEPPAEEYDYDVNDTDLDEDEAYDGDTYDHAAVLAQFGISAGNVEDYSNCLNPKSYRHYDSEIEGFSFAYPANLFNDVRVDDTAEPRDYGDHIRTVTLYGSKGTEYSYSVYRRTDNRTLEDAVKKVHQYEYSRFYDMEDILVASSKEKGGRVITFGQTDKDGDYLVYDLVMITDEYLYQMVIIKPDYKNDEERLEYEYVTENAYRMCGFSGSTKQPRSYAEYLEENN